MDCWDSIEGSKLRCLVTLRILQRYSNCSSNCAAQKGRKEQYLTWVACATYKILCTCDVSYDMVTQRLLGAVIYMHWLDRGWYPRQEERIRIFDHASTNKIAGKKIKTKIARIFHPRIAGNLTKLQTTARMIVKHMSYSCRVWKAWSCRDSILWIGLLNCPAKFKKFISRVPCVLAVGSMVMKWPKKKKKWKLYLLQRQVVWISWVVRSSRVEFILANLNGFSASSWKSVHEIICRCGQ